VKPTHPFFFWHFFKQSLKFLDLSGFPSFLAPFSCLFLYVFQVQVVGAWVVVVIPVVAVVAVVSQEMEAGVHWPSLPHEAYTLCPALQV
jgi:hypothetical protein